jgi:A/G-specific adenine glycosylase
VRGRLWEAAQQLLPATRPGDFNQAVMELGATVCSPRQPRCLICPWTRQCLARERGLQELLPEKARRETTRKSLQAAVAICHRGRFLIVCRSDQRLLKGFWEFPSTELRQRGSAAKRVASLISETYGLNVESLEPLITIKHSITTRRIELQVFRAKLAGGLKPNGNDPGRRWVRLKDMGSYAFASAPQRVVDALKRLSEFDHGVG